MNDKMFWENLEKLVKSSEIIIDRKKGSKHPKYGFIYPVDYGYLKNTTSMDNNGIDVWVGTSKDRKIDAIMCIIDLLKKDSEIKILINCTEEEKQLIYDMHNNNENMKGILINKG